MKKIFLATCIALMSHVYALDIAGLCKGSLVTGIALKNTRTLVSGITKTNTQALSLYDIFSDLLATYRSQEKLSDSDIHFITGALQFATVKHAAQPYNAHNDNPFITRPLEVALALARSGMYEPKILAAGLLHATLNKSKATTEEISSFFGEEVCTLIKQLSQEHLTAPTANLVLLQTAINAAEYGQQNQSLNTHRSTVEELRPRVGVAVLIMRNNQVLLGKRKGSHGAGSWAPPGGHLEFGENIFDCAKREVLEETGMKLKKVKASAYTNDIFTQENKHYVTLFVQAEIEDDAQPKLLEPDKCESWEWFDANELPKNLFLPLRNLVKTSGLV